MTTFSFSMQFSVLGNPLIFLRMPLYFLRIGLLACVIYKLINLYSIAYDSVLRVMFT